MEFVKRARLEGIARALRKIEYPTDANTGKPVYLSQLYGQYVFDDAKMKENLPKPVYRRFLQARSGQKASLDKETAAAIAHAVRIWAMDNKATHFCHIFQPLTHGTAEKHDSFLAFEASHDDDAATGSVVAIDSFSGGQLLQSEPDASSFPSGGIRSTFEARGYTIWDITSPMYLRETPNGTRTLTIPSVFISYNGEALDEKTIYLRSSEVLNKSALGLLHLLGRKEITSVVATLGVEQEFFVIDRDIHHLRPDITATGRSLVGALPPKHQQLDDHYFAGIPSTVLAMISEVEIELLKLGVPTKTRHNEVAPSQFEVAPIFEPANIAIDHNLLTMDVFSRVAHRYKLKTLFHEKPFKGVNGSGKHCNWSMQTDTMENLLEPTSAPEKNFQFLLFLVGVLQGLNNHSGLLRASVASASNDHRLGAQEAPPGIISAFLGEQLTEVLESIKRGQTMKKMFLRHLKEVKVGGSILELQIASVPQIHRDRTDRNRTSPFAFTGNKFEFRAVGSKQSPSLPLTLLNATAAAGIQEITEALKAKMGDKPAPSEEDIKSVLCDFIIKTERIRFEGNGYSEEWKTEAARRGLPNIVSAVDAFEQLLEEKNKSMLIDQGVLTEAELTSRYEVLMESYNSHITIEVNAFEQLLKHQLFGAVDAYRKFLADSALSYQHLNYESPHELETLKELDVPYYNARKTLKSLMEALHDAHKKEEAKEEAHELKDKVVPLMNELRSYIDQVEMMVPDKFWPIPRYRDLINK